MLPSMPPDFEPTRATLHAYALAASVIPRVHAEPHEKWWHVALSVSGNTWSTDPMPLPGGGTLTLRFDLSDHVLRLDTGDDRSATIPLDAGLTGTEFGDRLIAEVGKLGLVAEYARDKFESDEAREYDPAVATEFATVLSEVAAVFESHGTTLDGNVGQINLWPHGFDMAIEWFGTRVEVYEEHGELQEYGSQLNLGFYPGGRPYIYSNPWPFDTETLMEHQLPHGAEWHTEGWEGSVYHYDQLATDAEAKQKLAEFAKAVHDCAAPTLMVD